MFVNTLDYPASILPVTLVDKHTDVVDEGYKPLSEIDEKVYSACEFTQGRLCGGFANVA